MMVKEKICLWIESERKAKFQASAGKHHKTYTEALNFGMDHFIGEDDPVWVIDQAIHQRAQELEDLRLLRARAEITMKQKKKPESYENLNRQQESIREELFLEQKDFYIRNWGKFKWTWSPIIEKYAFQDEKEAKDWFRARIAREKAARTGKKP